MNETMVGMPEAAKILLVADHNVARRVLQREGIPLTRGKYGELFAERSMVDGLFEKRGRRRVPPGNNGSPRKNKISQVA